jgi:hypothetical protein
MKKGASPKRIFSVSTNDFGSTFKVGMKNLLSQTGKKKTGNCESCGICDFNVC